MTVCCTIIFHCKARCFPKVIAVIYDSIVVSGSQKYWPETSKEEQLDSEAQLDSEVQMNLKAQLDSEAQLNLEAQFESEAQLESEA